MASQPTNENGDESLEELDLDDAALISHQSEVHAPARRQEVQVDEPSIVVAEEPVASERRQANTMPRGRRALEPTLLIRDRRQAEDIRREMDQRIQAIKRQQLRSTILWVVLGVAAFGLGGVIALMVARSRVSSELDPTTQQTVGAPDGPASSE